MRVAGDSYPRLKIRADGWLDWGPGSADVDVDLYRYLSNMLRTDDALMLYQKPLHSLQGSDGAAAIKVYLSGDSYDRFQITGGGKFLWSSGSAAFDCELYRRAANILHTPDRLEVNTLGVENSAAGSTLGNVVKKIEVFDGAGNSLGFLAVYDSIT